MRRYSLSVKKTFMTYTIFLLSLTLITSFKTNVSAQTSTATFKIIDNSKTNDFKQFSIPKNGQEIQYKQAQKIEKIPQTGTTNQILFIFIGLLFLLLMNKIYSIKLKGNQNEDKKI